MTDVKLEQIRARGRALGLENYVLHGAKKTLIQGIQRTEGHEACFLTDKRLFCQERGCEWRSECCKLTAAWRR